MNNQTDLSNPWQAVYSPEQCRQCGGELAPKEYKNQLNIIECVNPECEAIRFVGVRVPPVREVEYIFLGATQQIRDRLIPNLESAWEQFVGNLEDFGSLENLEDEESIELSLPDEYVLFDHVAKGVAARYPKDPEQAPHFALLITEIKGRYGHHHLYAACYDAEVVPIFDDMVAGLKEDLMPAQGHLAVHRSPRGAKRMYSDNEFWDIYSDWQRDPGQSLSGLIAKRKVEKGHCMSEATFWRFHQQLVSGQDEDAA